MEVLTVLIPNYNGKGLLKQFLPSIFDALAYANVSYEFIVVDDCSTDDSVSFLASNYPEITVLENSTNQGFALTCNKGIAAASGEKLLLLNSDIKLDPSYIKTCLDRFKGDKTFAVSGIAKDNSLRPQRTGVLFSKGFCSIKKKKNTDSNETHFVSGANTMFDTAKLKQLRGFNPIYSPYYFEDDDLSMRAHQLGWKSYFLKEAECLHLGAHTIKTCGQKLKIKKIYFRNKFIFNYLHSRTPRQLFNIKSFAIDVLPRLMVGQFWIWNSFANYIKIVRETNNEHTKQKCYISPSYELNLEQ